MSMFGSPKPTASLSSGLLARKGHARPMGKLYSHDALKAKLQRAGLGEVRSYWAAPEMRFPAHYVPIDTASVSAARSSPGFRQGHGRKVNFLMRLMPAAWVRHVMPGLAFVAFKGPARP